MSWSALQKAKDESPSLFIKLKDGESMEGVFVGEPYSFYQKYGDPTEYENWSAGLGFKFRINFVTRNKVTKQLEAKILTGGATVRDALLDAKEEYGLGSLFKFKRTGSGKEDTRYAILFKEKLSPAVMEKINQVPLNRLRKSEHEESDANDTYFEPETVSTQDPVADDIQF